jgi:hypothetical protein
MIYTYPDINKIEDYVDGKYQANLQLVLAHIDPLESKDYTNWQFDHYIETDGTSRYKCVCSHHIKNAFAVRHIESEDQIVVGSSCVHRFNSDYIKLTKRAITLSKHPEYKYCPTCDKKVRQTLVDRYPDAQNVYHKKCWKQYYGIDKIRKVVMPFGKHACKSMGQILDTSRSYIVWLSENSYDKETKKISKILLAHNGASENISKGNSYVGHPDDYSVVSIELFNRIHAYI